MGLQTGIDNLALSVCFVFAVLSNILIKYTVIIVIGLNTAIFFAAVFNKSMDE